MSQVVHNPSTLVTANFYLILHNINVSESYAPGLQSPEVFNLTHVSRSSIKYIFML